MLKENYERVEREIGKDEDRSKDYQMRDEKVESNKAENTKETKNNAEGFYLNMIDEGEERKEEYRSKSGRVIRKPKTKTSDL